MSEWISKYYTKLDFSKMGTDLINMIPEGVKTFFGYAPKAKGLFY